MKTAKCSAEELEKIHGIGPKKAAELAASAPASASCEDIVRSSLGRASQLYMHYRADLEERVPRREVALHGAFVRRALRGLVGKVRLAGSYRRGLPDSGDVDVVAVSELPDAMPRIVGALSATGYLVGVLSSGRTRLSALCRLSQDDAKVRRLDVLLTTPAELPFAMLYFTGSKDLNIVLRIIASKRGRKLSQHGFSPMPRGVDFRTERDIFDFLNLKYLGPTRRNDVKNISHKE